jgi:hypothetical protein
VRLCACGMVALASPSLGQAPRQQVLSPATSILDREFTYIISVRELSDGRVLISDPREGPVVIADFLRNRTGQVGRIGSGPGEYPSVTGLTALAGDSTVMVDVSRRHWTILSGDRVVGALSKEAPIVSRVTSPLYTGSLNGTFLSIARLVLPTDSTAVILVPWNGLRQDTIVKFASPTPGSDRSVPAYPEMYDRAAIFPDGWIAVRRSDPYRVDWRTPAGQWIFGTPVLDPVTPVTAKEKEEYFKRLSVAGRSIPPGITLVWGETIPPIDASAALITSPSGSVMLRRTPTVTKPGTTYDVINRKGIREYQLVMPANHRIVGSGQKFVYVTVTDEEGLQRLQRHLWR